MSNQIKLSGTLHFIRCAVGDKTYGLEMAWIRTIQRVDQLQRASEKGAGNAGFVGWLPGRHEKIPVFSLARRMGYSNAPVRSTASQRIIVLPSPTQPTAAITDDKHLWALLVDQVSQVDQAPVSQFDPLPPLVTQPKINYFEGAVRLEEEVVLLLSPEWLHPDASLYVEGRYQLETQLGFLTAPRLARPRLRPDLDRPNGVQTQQNGQSLPVKGLDDQTRRIMIFSTPSSRRERDLLYALSAKQIYEILQPLPLTPVPAAPFFVLGLANWRNRLVPVIDLDACLGLTPQATLATPERMWLIIAHGAGQQTLVGFLAQPGIRIVRLPVAHQACPRTISLHQKLVRGIVEVENETLVLPDLENILRLGG